MVIIKRYKYHWRSGNVVWTHVQLIREVLLSFRNFVGPLRLARYHPNYVYRVHDTTNDCIVNVFASWSLHSRRSNHASGSRCPPMVLRIPGESNVRGLYEPSSLPTDQTTCVYRDVNKTTKTNSSTCGEREHCRFTGLTAKTVSVIRFCHIRIGGERS